MLVTCDYQISDFCKIEYDLTKSGLYQNKKRNNGKYRCKYCAISATHEGSKSHFFKNYKIEHSFFKNIDNEIKAYLLGVIAGDGHVSRKNIEVCANLKDVETLELIKSNLASDVPIRPKKQSNCSFIKFTSKEMSKDICKHLKIKPGKKSDKIQLPNLSTKLKGHFIRGLMDTDGCIDNPSKSTCPRCYYSSSSSKMRDDIQKWAKDKNIKTYQSGIKVYFVGKNAFQFMNEIYKNNNFSLSRKKEYYEVWKTWKSYEGTSLKPTKRKANRNNNE